MAVPPVALAARAVRWAASAAVHSPRALAVRITRPLLRARAPPRRRHRRRSSFPSLPRGTIRAISAARWCSRCDRFRAPCKHRKRQKARQQRRRSAARECSLFLASVCLSRPKTMAHCHVLPSAIAYPAAGRAQPSSRLTSSDSFIFSSLACPSISNSKIHPAFAAQKNKIRISI